MFHSMVQSYVGLNIKSDRLVTWQDPLSLQKLRLLMSPNVLSGKIASSEEGIDALGASLAAAGSCMALQSSPCVFKMLYLTGIPQSARTYLPEQKAQQPRWQAEPLQSAPAPLQALHHWPQE